MEEITPFLFLVQNSKVDLEVIEKQDHYLDINLYHMNLD